MRALVHFPFLLRINSRVFTTSMPTPKSDERKERHSGNPKSSVNADAKKVCVIYVNSNLCLAWSWR
jgi:hypothetical protein